MAITVLELAAALRIGDGVTAIPEPQNGILTRLLGVADAYTDLLIPNAPDAIKDQATIQFATYLFDQPSSSRGQSYSNAWVNSGAGALSLHWRDLRAGFALLEGSDGGSTPGAGSGLNTAQVNTLIATALANLDVPGMISNAITTLDVPGMIMSALTTLDVPGQINDAINALDVPGKITTHAGEAEAHHTIPTLAGGGFPTTRTQVLSGTLRDAANATMAASENWIGEQLYEFIVNNSNRQYLLTPDSGTVTFRTTAPFESPSGNTAVPYAEIIFDVGSSAVSTFQLHDVVSNSFATVVVNKLTN